MVTLYTCEQPIVVSYFSYNRYVLSETCSFKCINVTSIRASVFIKSFLETQTSLRRKRGSLNHFLVHTTETTSDTNGLPRNKVIFGSHILITKAKIHLLAYLPIYLHIHSFINLLNCLLHIVFLVVKSA